MATILCRNIQCIHYDCHVYFPLVADLPPDFLLSLLSSCLPTLSEVTWGGYEAGGVPNCSRLQFITLTTLRVASTQALSHLLGGMGGWWANGSDKKNTWQEWAMAGPTTRECNGSNRMVVKKNPWAPVVQSVCPRQESWPAMSHV